MWVVAHAIPAGAIICAMNVPSIPASTLSSLRASVLRARVQAMIKPFGIVSGLFVGVSSLINFVGLVIGGQRLREFLSAEVMILAMGLIAAIPMLVLGALTHIRVRQHLIVVQGDITDKRAKTIQLSKARRHQLQWGLRSAAAWRVLSDNTLGENVPPPETITLGIVWRASDTTPQNELAQVNQRVTALCWSNGDLCSVIEPAAL